MTLQTFAIRFWRMTNHVSILDHEEVRCLIIAPSDYAIPSARGDLQDGEIHVASFEPYPRMTDNRETSVNNSPPPPFLFHPTPPVTRFAHPPLHLCSFWHLFFLAHHDSSNNDFIATRSWHVWTSVVNNLLFTLQWHILAANLTHACCNSYLGRLGLLTLSPLHEVKNGLISC